MGCRARRSRSSGVLVSAAVVRFGSGRGRLREQPWASGHCSASRPESAARVDVHRGPANGVQRRREASRRGRRAMLNRSMCTLCTRAARCAGRVQRAACAAAALSRSRARTYGYVQRGKQPRGDRFWVGSPDGADAPPGALVARRLRIFGSPRA
ncbi:hypothetical protein M885DRAFT_507887 [Pelagophyceae sp. CCMP2097]|nr:hypothetical protein M885DRAFT_507887 [Pelagophyceae sp. CCMP2097]